MRRFHRSRQIPELFADFRGMTDPILYWRSSTAYETKTVSGSRKFVNMKGYRALSPKRFASRIDDSLFILITSSRKLSKGAILLY
jgi:hypothetical protein